MVRVWRHHGVQPERRFFQVAAIGFDVGGQFHPEVVEREIVQCHGFVEVFEVEHLVFQTHELLVAVAQIFGDQLAQVFGLQNVVFRRGSNVHQRHACLDPVFEVDVLVEVGRGPEVDELDFAVQAADAVDATEALDDSHRVPVDVIVDQEVAVLQVLALADAVCGNQDVDLAVLWHRLHLASLFGAWREVGEDVAELGMAEGAAVGPRAT